MDAKKREKVIRGLEKCTECLGCCSDECPYYSHTSSCSGVPLRRDALALMKEQEPRVLEYSEIEKNPLVWLEDNDKEDVIPALFLQYNGWNAEFAVQAPDKYNDTIVRSVTVSAFEEMYGITWRAWTAKPTPDQRLEVPWE